MAHLNVAIADDNERILEILGEIVSSDKDLTLVGKANNGEDMYQIIKNKQPDVVLLDLIMPKMDGLCVMDEVAKDFYNYIIEVASGKKVCSEIAGFHDMAIFKQGVTL